MWCSYLLLWLMLFHMLLMYLLYVSWFFLLLLFSADSVNWVILFSFLGKVVLPVLYIFSVCWQVAVYLTNEFVSFPYVAVLIHLLLLVLDYFVKWITFFCYMLEIVLSDYFSVFYVLLSGGCCWSWCFCVCTWFP